MQKYLDSVDVLSIIFTPNINSAYYGKLTVNTQ